MLTNIVNRIIFIKKIPIECFLKDTVGKIKLKKKYTAAEVKNMILDSAASLFIEKGYEQTSISDIVSGLDGLTKGAVYHHFESKYQIIKELAYRFIPNQTILNQIDTNNSLTGLQKIQTLLIESMFGEEIISSTASSIRLLEDSIFTTIYQKQMNEHLVPLIEKYIEAGNQDGSINTPQPKEMAEVVILLITTWFIPSLFETTADNFFNKLTTAQLILNNSGLAILSDDVLQTITTNLITKGE